MNYTLGQWAAKNGIKTVYIYDDTLIIFTADTHAPDDLEFKMFPPHCVRGTSDVEIIPELASAPA